MNVRFGYVPIDHEWTIAEYTITPVDQYREAVDYVTAEANEAESFYYPRECFTARGTDAATMVRVPRSRHIESMFKLPATHCITWRSQAPPPSRDDFLRGEGSLLIHGLGFLLRLRCQFEDWWYEARIPTKQSPICLMRVNEIGQVLAFVLQEYRTWPQQTRSRFANALFVKSRTSSHHWTSEQFASEYAVFDALYQCWHTRPAQTRRRQGKHGKRFAQVGEAGLVHWDARHAAEAQAFVLFRNDLIHEGLWLGGTPLSGGFPDGVRHLSQLNDRLVLALTKVECGFRSTSWMGMEQRILDLRP